MLNGTTSPFSFADLWAVTLRITSTQKCCKEKRIQNQASRLEESRKKQKQISFVQGGKELYKAQVAVRNHRDALRSSLCTDMITVIIGQRRNGIIVTLWHLRLYAAC